MKSKQITKNNVRALKPQYMQDDVLDMNSHVVTTHQGLQLCLSDITQDATDSKVNDGDLLTLTNKRRLRGDASIKHIASSDRFPYSLITYLVYDDSTQFMYNPQQSLDKIPVRNNPQYLQIQEIEGDISSARQYTISNYNQFQSIIQNDYISNNRLFEIELLDETKCRVHHDDGFVKSSLTYDDMDDSRSRCSFTPHDMTSDDLTHSQVFMYVIDNASGYMGLMKTLNDGSRTSIKHTGNISGVSIISDGHLAGDPDLITNTWHPKTIAKIQRSSLTDINSAFRNCLNTSWYNYKSWKDSRDLTLYRYEDDTIDNNSYRFADHNDVEVDERQSDIYGDGGLYYIGSYVDLTNNFLLDCQYTNVSGDVMPINITPLKNQMTPQGTITENSPHAVGDAGDFCLSIASRNSVDLRTYHKIFSGTNQNRGDDMTFLGYTSYTDQLVFPGDKITYFHMPNVMKPYVWFNINYRRVPDEYPIGGGYDDSMKLPVSVPGTTGYDYEDFVGLIRSGAIAGSSPVNADKIFKKRSDYRFFSNWGDSGQSGNVDDSMYGTWLCAWLRITDDETSEFKFGPVWMDRYYDDTRFSENQVLDKPSNCIDTTSNDTSLLERVMIRDGYIDVPSELRIERGVLYAYHHIGPKNTRDIISSFDKYMFHKDIDQYTQVSSTQQTPARPGVYNGYNQYDFTGAQFGRTKAPDPAYGDFRVSFWMHSDDWTSPFGHRVFGNYTNDGIAVENDSVVTPVLLAVGENDVQVMNTHGQDVTTITSDRYTKYSGEETPVIHVTKSDVLSNITTIESTQGSIYMNSFNLNGTHVDEFDVSGGLINRKGVITDTYSVENYVFTLFDNTSGTGRLDVNTGEFIDMDITDFETLQISGAPSRQYDPSTGIYFVIDTTISAVNNKPVYVGYSSSNLQPKYMYSSETPGTWLFTSDTSFLNGGTSVTEMSGFGVIPSTFQVQDSEPVGTSFVYKNDFIPTATYLTPETQSIEYNRIVYADKYSLFVVDGDCVCTSPSESQGGTNMLHFTKNGKIYSHKMSDNTKSIYTGISPVFETAGNIDVQNIKSDTDNNLWIYYNNDQIAKYDSDYNLLFSVSLSSHVDQSSTRTLSGHKSFDLIREYKTGAEASQYAIVLHKNEHDDLLDVINISPHGELTFANTVSGSTLDAARLGQSLNISSFNNINSHYKRKNNTLTFKFKAKNKYNQRDFVNISESFDVENIAPGWHHFSFGFDANLKGIGYFYIDGLLVKESAVLKTTELGKYGFTDVLNKITTVGATQGFNNELLSNLLGQPGYYHSKNFSIKSLRMYNFNLFRDFIKTLAREHLPVHDMIWTIPSGRRGHLDHVDKFHKHRLPGHKSSDYTIDLIDTGIVGGAQQYIEQRLQKTIKDFTPSLTNNTKINWIT